MEKNRDVMSCQLFSKWPLDQPNGGHLKPWKKGHSEPTLVLSSVVPYSSFRKPLLHQQLGVGPSLHPSRPASWLKLASCNSLNLHFPWDGGMGLWFGSEWGGIRSVSSKTTWENVVSIYPSCWGDMEFPFLCWAHVSWIIPKSEEKRHQF